MFLTELEHKAYEAICAIIPNIFAGLDGECWYMEAEIREVRDGLLRGQRRRGDQVFVDTKGPSKRPDLAKRGSKVFFCVSAVLAVSACQLCVSFSANERLAVGTFLLVSVEAEPRDASASSGMTLPGALTPG